jgi:YVTN family beta-propeller protein
VSKIDLRNLEVIKSKIPVGKGPHGIAFNEDGEIPYISNMKSNDVSVIDTSTDKVIDTIPGGGIEPHQIVMKKTLSSNS